MTAAEKTAKAKEILNSNPSEEDVRIAVGLTKEAMEENDAEALSVMGRLYYVGIGVEQDHEKSFRLCQQALDAGCEKAKTILAIYYVLGNVVERDIPLALQYLRDRMAENESFAYFIMGDFVFQNVFPDIEWETFVDYFKKAIDLGESVAMVRLAEKYNIICEPEQADYWYQQAAEAGVIGVEESKAQFTEENYKERRQNILNFYIGNGKYDKAIALVDRDLADGDESARWLQAENYVRGLGAEAYGRDLPKALAICEQLADEGEPHANFVLGLLYNSVEEIKDPQKALRYMRKAADDCHPNALFIMATNYLQDQDICTKPQFDFGLEKNEELGMDLLQKAAEVGDSNALFCLSLCYSQGKYLEQDDEQAFMLLLQSVEQEANANKVQKLADMYRDGKGVEQDYEKAAQYYQWASDNGSFAAASHLALLYHEGKGVEQNDEMASRLIEHSQELMQWQLFGKMPLSVVLNEAEKGNPTAMHQLGDRYQKGDGVEQDMEKAVEWWKKAAEQGDVSATHNVGVYYYEHEDLPNAKEYLKKAISLGFLDSYYTLAFCYLHNAAVEGNVQKGIDCLEAAAKKGHLESQWQLACIYHDGTYGTKDLDKARYWLDKCLEAEYPMAHYAMAGSLVHGDMYPKDLGKALEHYRKAVELGCHDADEDYISLRWLGVNGAEANREEVISVYKQLAEKNDTVAMFNLYKFYYDDTYEGHDNKLAANYLKQSADAGYIDAMLTMGQQLLDDDLFPEDRDAAFKYFAQLAEIGNMVAQAWLGYCYEFGYGTDKDVNKAIELYTSAAEKDIKFAIHNLAKLYLVGEDGILEPDYDKALEVLQPYKDCGDSEIDYLMAIVLNNKITIKNAYSWELASQAFDHMKKAAEAGHVGAMNMLSFWYLRGEGVISDDEEAKTWLQQCQNNGGTITDDNYPEWYSGENFDSYSVFAKETYWKGLVEANIDRIENALEMEDSEGNFELWNILLNVSQIGEMNAVLALGHFGMNFLKTDPERAKTYITAASKGGFPHSAYNAGMEWLKDGIENDAAVEHAMEYFSIGAEHGSVDCFLQIGLYYTDRQLEGEDGYEEALKNGIKCLQAVSNVEGEDYEEQRQQARARLAEIEQRPKLERPKSTWSKIKKGLGTLLGKA